ncbi:Gfo/Idh/MocA family protein [Cohnella cholangitidis]|nr:Gfo/Idh/MocA family oxidoreductase [Cohnella cholangitidis]
MPNIAMLSCWNHYHAKSFVRDLAEFPEARIVAAWDDDLVRGRAYAEEFGAAFEPNLAALLARPDIDGVIVDSSPEQAASLIEIAAKAGKHVLADQVLALTLEEANRVAAWIRRSNIHFALDMSLMRWPVNLAAKKVAVTGAIGGITGVRIRNAHDGASGEVPLASRFLDSRYGVFTDLGAHCLYLMHWLLGQPVAVTAITSSYSGNKAEDNAASLFEYANGMLAICDSSYAADQSPFSIELYGTAGSFLGGGASGVHRKLLQPSDSMVRFFAPEARMDALQEAAALPEAGESTLSLWLKAIQGRDSEILTGVEEGIALAATLEALYLSAQTGRKILLKDLQP